MPHRSRLSSRSLLPLALVVATVALLVAGCGQQTPPESRSYLVTLLGSDTLAVEAYTTTANAIEARVVLRSPRTQVGTYRLLLAADSLIRWETAVYEPDSAGAGSPISTETVAWVGDSLLWSASRSGETRSGRFLAPASVLPFVDMVHFPFDLMLSRAVAAGADSTSQILFAGGRPMPFVIRRTASDSMTVTHPFRGTMGVSVDANGRLLLLDAGQTTRALTVRRVAEIDLDAAARRFAALDAEGRSMGALSSREEPVFALDGATIRLDYGVPYKRGRAVFGGLLPWDTLWRTGANRATHLTTDQDLMLGDLFVPAGTYTLYTIPSQAGGTLIVNKQTGQGGTTYNEDQDLGRVPMRIESLPEVVEAFTIRVEDSEDGAALLLEWDQTRFSAPLAVR